MRIKQYHVKRGRIEIIPMIDVVFFLLVFSMLSALSMAEVNTLSPDVPKTGSGAGGAANRVTVNDIKGKLFLTFETPTEKSQITVTPDQVAPMIQKEFDRNAGLVVLMNCDDSLSFQQGAQLMDSVKATGAPVVVPAGM